MKQRFSSLDIQIIASELRSTLVGHRVSNIYDLSARIFLLKFALPDSKHLLVIDSGFRVHLTSFTRETAPTQSTFVTKLRKHLRTRRLTAVRQLGIDRVLDLEFSDGLYHVYLEFFAGGNVILTDADRKMLAVLRIVSAGEDGRGECRNGAIYEAGGRAMPPPVTREIVAGVLEEAVKRENEPAAEEEEGAEKKRRGKFQKKKKKGEDTLKRVLGSRLPEFSPVLVEHVLLGVGVDPLAKAEEVLASEETVGKVVQALHDAEKILGDLTGSETKKGYIIAKEPKPREKVEGKGEKKAKGVSFGNAEAVEEEEAPEKVQEEGDAKGLVFDDFHPFLPRQFVGVPGVKTLEYKGFNTTVDTFFSSIEAQKLESRLKDREETAAKRLQDARNAHARRLEALQDVQGTNVRKAQAIEANKHRVEEAIAAVNSLIGQGMDWVAIAHLIEAEQKRGNAVAELIQLPLKLYENTITLKLQEVAWEEPQDSDSDSDDLGESEEEEEDEKESSPKQKPLIIDVDLSQTAFANARHYYDQKKTAAKKETKTAESSSKALKSTERKITADLKRTLKTEKAILRPVRKALWFEKFLFFISSDGYLVLGGRDAQQSEHLYKRHFRRGDVYVHADINGAAHVICKNNPATPNAPIPPSTLQQAGQLAVCTSQAWDQKAVLAAWWVGFEQVSKTAPAGDFLPTGTFHVKGEKNYLPPAQLLLGYGVLWMIDEESKKRHIKHRVVEVKDESSEEAKVDAGEPDDSSEKPTETQPTEEAAPKEEEEKSQSESSSEEESSDDEEFPDAQIEPTIKPTPSEPAPETAPETADFDSESESEIPSTKPSKPSTPAGLDSSAPRPHLSAKQRRDLKKGKLPTPSQTPTETTRTSTPNPVPVPAPTKLPRGKRTKAKRAAQNYDPEAQALAQSLLGIKTGGAAEKPEAEKETPKETPLARKTRLREQHARAQAAGLESEARRHDAEAEEEEHEIATTPLDALVPDPYDDDVILDAIPVCAPWGAMGRYKWRVKMQPGAGKKGKAVREVWTAWTTGKAAMGGKEREMVAGWREADIVNCVGVSKVKVMGVPGKVEGKGGQKGKGTGKGRGKGSKK